MLTYNLSKNQSMLLSATSRKGQPDADLHPVQKSEHALVSSQMMTYILSKNQSILLSARSRKGQSDADLHTVQKP
jgi:hypothetical protein